MKEKQNPLDIQVFDYRRPAIRENEELIEKKGRYSIIKTVLGRYIITKKRWFWTYWNGVHWNEIEYAQQSLKNIRGYDSKS